MQSRAYLGSLRCNTHKPTCDIMFPRAEVIKYSSPLLKEMFIITKPCAPANLRILFSLYCSFHTHDCRDSHPHFHESCRHVCLSQLQFSPFALENSAYVIAEIHPILISFINAAPNLCSHQVHGFTTHMNSDNFHSTTREILLWDVSAINIATPFPSYGVP